MTLLQTAQFKKDLKRYRHRQEAMEALFDVLRHLQSNGRAPARCSPHRLKGQFSGCMECHVRSDLLLIWIDQDTSTIRLLRFGTHHEILGR